MILDSNDGSLSTVLINLAPGLGIFKLAELSKQLNHVYASEKSLRKRRIRNGIEVVQLRPELGAHTAGQLFKNSCIEAFGVDYCADNCFHVAERKGTQDVQLVSGYYTATPDEEDCLNIDMTQDAFYQATCYPYALRGGTVVALSVDLLFEKCGVLVAGVNDTPVNYNKKFVLDGKELPMLVMHFPPEPNQSVASTTAATTLSSTDEEGNDDDDIATIPKRRMIVTESDGESHHDKRTRHARSEESRSKSDIT